MQNLIEEIETTRKVTPEDLAEVQTGLLRKWFK